MKISIIALLSFFSFSLHALDDVDRQQIQQRIEPVGKVHIQDQNDNKTETGVEDTAVATVEKKEPGQEIYEHYCITCHRDGLAGAPKFRDANDWNSRKAGQTLDEMVALAIKGLNAMPPKGTCLECSDADLKAAIQYMLPKS